MRKHRKVLLAVIAVLFIGIVFTSTALADGSERNLESVQAQTRNIIILQHKPRSVLNFWDHRGKWALHLRSKDCSMVSGAKQQKVCSNARASLARNRKLLDKLQDQLVASVARYADEKLVSARHAGSPLRSELKEIVRASYEEGISPFLVLSIAGKESTFGRHRCGMNAWGWNRCSTNGWSSFAEGARVVARSLRVDYLGRWGKNSVSEIGYTYCGSTCGGEWSSGVGYFMDHIFSAGAALRWGEAMETIT